MKTVVSGKILSPILKKKKFPQNLMAVRPMVKILKIVPPPPFIHRTFPEGDVFTNFSVFVPFKYAAGFSILCFQIIP